MRKMRWWQCGGLFAAILLVGVPMVGAQDAEQQEEILGLEDYKVVGSRLPGRSAQDSPVPVDVIQGADLQTYGIRDMDSLLSATVPSYNVNQQPISDAATLVRPANLRGLSPDSTLVLVNGKRRHRASVISFADGTNYGTQGADLSVIPSIALERVEVLRDGAAAQYGSDAIAGILNFRLREDTQGLSVHTSWGQNYHGDGDKVNVAANLGLPLTDRGFANFSFEFMNADETSRSVQRDDARALIEAGNMFVRQPAAQIWGAPEVQYDYKFFGNLGLDLEALKARLYAFGNYAERKVEGGFFFRNPNTRSGVFSNDRGKTLLVADLSEDLRGCGPPVNTNAGADYSAALGALPEHCFAFNERFPGGFTPRFGGYMRDWSIAFGLRGELESAYALLNGWFYDASASFGHNSVDFFMHNTINPQLAAMRTNIPTTYRPGGNTQFERTFNLDISRPFDIGIFYSPLNTAFGFEYHMEEYEQEVGEENSWFINKNLADQGFGIGSNGFTGYRPDSAGVFERNNYALYMDLEAQVIKSLTLGLAGRYENFEGDIGESVNGKASARWQLLEALALRGSVGSGFRAPTPGQANIRKVNTTFTDSGLVDQGIFPSHHPVAAFFGGKPLEPEKSVNYSVGTVFNAGAFSATIDYYRIKIQDRIGLTTDFTVSEKQRAAFNRLSPDASSITSVRYFTNAFDTTVQGVDIVATYPLETLAGDTLFTFAGNWNDLKVDSRDRNVIDDKQVRQMEDGLPEFRFSLTADHVYGPWRLLTRAYFYDDFFEAHGNSSSRFLDAGERWLMDLEASYTFMNIPFMEAVTLAAGAENVFDTYPRRNPYARDLGAKYPESSPYGFNGGFYYLRAGFEF